MLSKIKKNSDQSNEMLVVIFLTLVVLLCFSIDVFSEEGLASPIAQSVLPEEKLQVIVKYIPDSKYNGISIEQIEDWSKRQQLLQYMLAHHEEIAQKPKPPIQTTTTPTAKKPGYKSTPMSSSIGKASITYEQAGKSKKYLALKKQSLDSELAIEEKEYYEKKYNISSYEELPICVVVPTYNNVAEKRYRQNMDSIIQQDYQNYRIIVIDDASSDDTGKFIEQYANSHHLSDEKIKIVINKERTMAMPNIYMAAHEFCKPYEIFMIVDGDDEIVGKQVFKHFNAVFQQKKVWVMYTNFISMRGSIGYSRPFSETTIKNNSYRRSGFVISHLRAFYTKLLQLININDLKDEEGNWYRAANDVAMYLPILQMSHQKVLYVPEISYMYNSNTGLNNHRTKLREQKGNERKIKTKKAYKGLNELFTPEQAEQLKANMGKSIQMYQQGERKSQKEKAINTPQNTQTPEDKKKTKEEEKEKIQEKPQIKVDQEKNDQEQQNKKKEENKTS